MSLGFTRWWAVRSIHRYLLVIAVPNHAAKERCKTGAINRSIPMVGEQALTHKAVFDAATLVKCRRYQLPASHDLTLQHKRCRLSLDRASRLHGWTRALDRDFRLERADPKRITKQHSSVLACRYSATTDAKAVQTPTPGCKNWDWPITWRS